PGFARELDEWAADGFPRKGTSGRASSPERGRSSLFGWLRMRPLVPVMGAAATLLVGLVVITSVVRQNSGSDGGATDQALTTEQAPSDAATAPSAREPASPKLTEDSGGAAGT